MRPFLAVLLTTFATAALADDLDTVERSIRRQVARVRDSDTESWRRIPWTASLTDAAKAAGKEGRPLFVFSHEGNIDTGRC